MPQKTYWHLTSKRRMPSDYEIGSSNLLYYPGRGFETDTPVASWYEEYQQKSPFTCKDWELFHDPQEMTYATYTSMQAAKETYVDGLLSSIDKSGYDRDLSEEWVEKLCRVIAPLRYPWHGFQMIACYVGQMAPGSRVTISSMFQAADEIRRIQRIAYRVRQLQLSRSGAADSMDSLKVWTEDPMWQPLREAVERLLVVRDWGEAFVGLNLVLKPFMDGLFHIHFGRRASLVGDHVLYQILNSFEEDCQWNRQWSQALVRTVIDQQPNAKGHLETWVKHWSGFAVAAVRGFEPAFRDAPAEFGTFTAIASELEISVRENVRRAGLSAI